MDGHGAAFSDGAAGLASVAGSRVGGRWRGPNGGLMARIASRPACWGWPCSHPCQRRAASQSSNAVAPSLSQARKDLLTLSEMPAGWTSTKNPNTGNNTVGDTELAHCVGVATALIAENPPSVDSRRIPGHPGHLTVADNVTVFPSAQNAAAEEAVSGNPKLPGA